MSQLITTHILHQSQHPPGNKFPQRVAQVLPRGLNTYDQKLSVLLRGLSLKAFEIDFRAG
ncbi:hypothetical protein [Microseira sp. BLCC-F43]|uniref:hypothetical protein n=1 Tax=Microseira sp. BLCC-F43 TaxID=3153602 RepID=UPI0035B9B0DB